MANISRDMPRLALTAIPFEDNLRVDQLVRAGVPATAFREILALLEIDVPTLAEAVRIPRRTLERRLASTSVPPFDEGDRVVRIGRLIEKTMDVFEGQGEATRWFTEKLELLGGASPLECCATDAGARAVEQVLGRIEHGVFG